MAFFRAVNATSTTPSRQNALSENIHTALIVMSAWIYSQRIPNNEYRSHWLLLRLPSILQSPYVGTIQALNMPINGQFGEGRYLKLRLKYIKLQYFNIHFQLEAVRRLHGFRTTHRPKKHCHRGLLCEASSESLAPNNLASKRTTAKRSSPSLLCKQQKHEWWVTFFHTLSLLYMHE